MAKLVVLVVVAALAACGGKAGAPVVVGPSPTPAPSPASAPAVVAPPPLPASVSGTVVETMSSGGYTYLRIRTGSLDVWAAVPLTEVKVGAHVALRGVTDMGSFTSKSLRRTFDRILFGQLAADSSSQPAAHPPVARPVTLTDLKVPRATGPGARTVAGVFADAATLKDKAVVVHGVVVKFSAGIMRKNWIHLRDGTGSPGKKDHDLTVTTLDTVKVGDRVKVRGTVRRNKDFGFGYKFATMVEEAKVQPLK